MTAPKIHPSAVVGPRVEIAEDAVIGPNCRLDGKTIIGARTRLERGVTLLDARIGEDCVLGPGVATSAPGSQADGPLELDDFVHVGAGSILAPGVRIGRNVRIAPDTTVARDLSPFAIAEGRPAVVVGFDTTAGLVENVRTDVVSAVAGAKLYSLPSHKEPRGVLSYAEVGRQIPFEVKRYFLVYGVPQGETRGEHAHKECEEFLVCVQGKVTVLVDDGQARQEFLLDDPDIGLHIPNLVWTIQYAHSPDAVLVVLTSHPYEAADYLKDYEGFLAARRAAA